MIRAKTLKVWYLVHKWSSLVSTLFLLMLCVTGLPLIFHHEIDHALGYSVEAPEIAGQASRADVGEIIADARARRPGDAMQFLVGDPDDPDIWFVRMGTTPRSETMSAFFTYDARTGRLLSEYPLGEGIMNVVLRLHVDLFAGLPGTLFLGAMGLLLVVALISGVALYGRFMRKLRFGTIRADRTPRLRWLDLHNLLGIATLVWLFVVGMTGVVNALSTPIFTRWQATELARLTAPYASLHQPDGRYTVDRAVNAAFKAAPGMSISFMAFPGNEFAGPHHFVAFMQGNEPLTSRLLEAVLIDARTGAVVEKSKMPWYVTVLLLSQPLHFGDYGGLPLKILWAILDLLAIIVLGSGVYLWVKKRKISYETWLVSVQTEQMNDVQTRTGRFEEVRS